MSATGWYDRNEARRYPLADDASPGFPDDVLADLSVSVPAHLVVGTSVPVLHSISVGNTYASFVVRCGGVDVAWFGGDPSVHTALPLIPLVDGASGFAVFGTGVLTWRGVAAPSAPLAISAFSVSFTDTGTTVSVTNDGMTSYFAEQLSLVAGDYVNIAYHENYGPYANVIRVTMNASIETDKNEAILGNCARNVQNRSCLPSVITEINGVRSDGEAITLRIINRSKAIGVVDISDAVVVLRTEVSQTRACENRAAPVDISKGLVKTC